MLQTADIALCNIAEFRRHTAAAWIQSRMILVEPNKEPQRNAPTRTALTPALLFITLTFQKTMYKIVFKLLHFQQFSVLLKQWTQIVTDFFSFKILTFLFLHLHIGMVSSETRFVSYVRNETKLKKHLHNKKLLHCLNMRNYAN
jgi:hypothetical protein